MNEQPLAPVLVAFVDLDIQGWVFFAIRLVAGVGGAIVGWFVTAPFVRILYRVVVRRHYPRWAIPWTRLAGAVTLGLLLFYFLPLGGGAGWGFGPGPGGGPGGIGGPNQHAGNGTGKDKKDAKLKDTEKSKKDKPEAIKIELIGGDRYKGDERYYLLNRKEPPQTLEELKELLFEKNKNLEIVIVLTPDSVASTHGAVKRLEREIEKTYDYKPKIDFQEPKDLVTPKGE